MLVTYPEPFSTNIQMGPKDVLGHLEVFSTRFRPIIYNVLNSYGPEIPSPSRFFLL